MRHAKERAVLANLHGNGFRRGAAGRVVRVIGQDSPHVSLVSVSRVQVEFINARHVRTITKMVAVVELDLVAFLGPRPRRTATNANKDIVVECTGVEERSALAAASFGRGRVFDKAL